MLAANKISITTQLTDGAIKSPQLVKPITEISGQLSFDGTDATLKEFSANYGLLVTTVDGTFNQQKGFNLNFASTVLDLAKGLESFNIKTPVAIAGEVKLAGKLTGTTQKPALTLNITTPKSVSFDRVTVDRFLATIELKDLNTLQIKKFKPPPQVQRSQAKGKFAYPKKINLRKSYLPQASLE